MLISAGRKYLVVRGMPDVEVSRFSAADKADRVRASPDGKRRSASPRNFTMSWKNGSRNVERGCIDPIGCMKTCLRVYAKLRSRACLDDHG